MCGGTARPIFTTGYAAACRAIAEIDLTERLVNIEVPTLVLVGSDDTSTTPEMALQIHEPIPGSEYMVIPQVAHLTNVAAPDTFVAAIISEMIRGEISGDEG